MNPYTGQPRLPIKYTKKCPDVSEWCEKPEDGSQ